MQRNLVIGMLLCCTLGQIASAHTQMRPEEDELFSRLGKAFNADLDISKEQNQKFQCTVTGKFNLASGRFDDAELFKSSGNPQTDLDMLDAVLSLERVPVPTVLRENGVLEIEFKTGQDERAANFARFQRQFKPKANCSAFHSIPLSVLRKYPAIFRYSELATSSHLRNLANDKISPNEIKKLRQPWLTFFDEHSTATKKELLELEKRVDEQFELSTR